MQLLLTIATCEDKFINQIKSVSGYWYTGVNLGLSERGAKDSNGLQGVGEQPPNGTYS